jgi:hypothetical protein
MRGRIAAPQPSDTLKHILFGINGWPAGSVVRNKKTARRRSFCNSDRGCKSGHNERPRPPISLPNLWINLRGANLGEESNILFRGRKQTSVAQTTQEGRLDLFGATAGDFGFFTVTVAANT